MKADTTRSTFKKAKHYNGVLMQQGRVQLDADWNEQLDITGHRIETETLDVMGHCGAPMHDAGFHIVASGNDLTAEEKTLSENQNPPAVASGDLLISGGRYYVDGILCESEQIVAYTKQPDFPNVQPVASAGTYLAYIDVWSRHITALEDASIREVALGGPDTATRSKTVWQVKLFQVGALSLAANCSTAFASWDAEIAAGTGKLAARAAVSTPSNDPCIVAPGAGYRRLENQHYRVEVHDKGNLGVATFKWSRDNGSVVTKWESQNVNDLTVSSIGRDKVLSFASGQWVELIDDTIELSGKPGTLVQLVKAEGNVLTINPATATGLTAIVSFPRNPRIRRWDMAALLKPNSQNWIDLEEGVQVQCAAGSYKTGDYWLIPARTATADVEWPMDSATNQPATQLPFGIQHHYCRLAVAKFDGTNWTGITDCRHIFPPLTELIDFFYVGGDGQEAMPDLTQPNVLTPLAQPIEAGVTNGEWPVAGASVRFTVIKGNGRLQGNQTQAVILTAANGVASCPWSLDSSTWSQQVEAVLLDDGGNPIGVPIHYTANLSVASQVRYTPPQDCPELAGKTDVQAAIDALCAVRQMGCCHVIVGPKEKGGQFESLDEAVQVLLKNAKDQRVELCICLLPGDHPLKGGLSITGTKGRQVHVKIEGCGPGSRILIQNKPLAAVGLASFNLRNVGVLSEKEGSIALESCADVTFGNCYLVRENQQDLSNAFVTIAHSRRILFEHNLVDAVLRLDDNPLSPLKIFSGISEQIVALYKLSRSQFDEKSLSVAEALAKQLQTKQARGKFVSQLSTKLENITRLTPSEAAAYNKLISTLSTATEDAKAMDPALLRAHLADIRLAGLRAVPGTAIVLMDAEADTRMEGNGISGVVSLYGMPGQSTVTADERKTISTLLKKGPPLTFSGSSSNLHVRDNTISRIAVAEEMIRLLKQIAKNNKGGSFDRLYRRCFLVGNAFNEGNNDIVMEHVALTSNSFENEEPAGTVIAAAAIYTGTYAQDDVRLFNVTKSSQKSANLGINIVEL
ncbi:hypothetical protein YTPLAS18_03750 [Nitrospira sp.]|nr:hypothetical protein YTPLAS18_03750 [Nitrospira sp.]